jgi:hypothetical protein
VPTTGLYKQARAIDGWLLLGTEQKIDAVPLRALEQGIPERP